MKIKLIHKSTIALLCMSIAFLTPNLPVSGQETQTATVENADAAEPVALKLGDLITMSVTGNWKQVAPKISMIEAEFAIPAVEGDERDGRLTIMAASGGIEANIARWAGQFKQGDGSETKPKTGEKTIDDMEVHVVDIAGNFMDSMGGPFGPKVEREDYRMLAAIVETGTSDYFLKLYGPAKTIAENEDEFRAAVDSIKKVAE